MLKEYNTVITCYPYPNLVVKVGNLYYLINIFLLFNEAKRPPKGLHQHQHAQ